MFNMDDIDNIKHSNPPMGISDETEFAIIMQSVANLLKNSEIEEVRGREQLAMQIINIACSHSGHISIDRAVSVILSLTQHIVGLIHSLNNIEDIDIINYFDHYQKNIMGPMFDNTGVPYYE